MITKRSFHHITNTKHPTKTKLARLLDTTGVIQRMTKDERGLQMKTPPFATSLFEELEMLGPLDLLSTIMANQMGLVDIGARYHRYLLESRGEYTA
jgi:hypothetical protein